MRAPVSEYELVVAKTLPEALALLSANDGWRPMAGGTDLMVLFNAGHLASRHFVSVRSIPEIREIEVSSDRVLIGSGATYSEIRRHAILQAEFPLLGQAAGWTGGTANQNRATLGGNIANASPAADSAPMLLAYDAELELTSSKGVRRLPYAGFHLAYKTMQMRSDELITRICLSRPARERVQYARKVGTRRAQAISKVCFAGVCEREKAALCHVRIAVGSVAPIPLRCFATEKVLEGCTLTSAVIAKARDALRCEIQPITDLRSTDLYRAQVSMNLLGEFLESAR